jgi:hypothetical protein
VQRNVELWLQHKAHGTKDVASPYIRCWLGGPYCQVMVASKFDNRLKEFGERWEVDKYLSATGYLPPSVKPFFVALPKAGPSYACWV